jgi:hypothetical protein
VPEKNIYRKATVLRFLWANAMGWMVEFVLQKCGNRLAPDMEDVSCWRLGKVRGFFFPGLLVPAMGAISVAAIG